ncbi:hypothetical protein D3C86_1850640 [compost metagenome]
MAASRFLQLDISFLGYISSDSHVVQAVKRQIPFSVAFPNSAAAKDVLRLALSYLAADSADITKVQGIKGFISKWLKRKE